MNDREFWVGIDQIQYDSPTVKFGQRHPIVSRKDFDKWAGEEVTDMAIMTRYKVIQTYTPDDTSRNRDHKEAEFVNESTDLVELAYHARLAILGLPTDVNVQNAARRLVEESADQLEDQEPEAFVVILFTNNGEYELDVERLD